MHQLLWLPVPPPLLSVIPPYWRQRRWTRPQRGTWEEQIGVNMWGAWRFVWIEVTVTHGRSWWCRPQGLWSTSVYQSGCTPRPLPPTPLQWNCSREERLPVAVPVQPVQAYNGPYGACLTSGCLLQIPLSVSRWWFSPLSRPSWWPDQLWSFSSWPLFRSLQPF